MAERTSEAVGSGTQTVTIDQVDGRGTQEIKVLDLTRIVAGPYCTMLLGDLGAKVIKVEAPDGGDECRNWPPNLNNDKEEISCYFAALNRNKKSICINFKSASGIRIVHDLAEKCDVLVENFVPGKLDSMGLGYEQLKARAPHLIYCSLSGFGKKGPYRFRPGLDVIAASIGGMLHITGPADGEPCKPGVAMTDIATGLYAQGAILAALLQRSKTRRGQKIDCNLLSTQVACLINIASNYLNIGMGGQRHGTAHESIVPYQSFQTSDGYITVAGVNNAQFVSLCERLDVEELTRDQRFSNNLLRVQNRKKLIELLKPHFLRKTTAELVKLFEGASFPFGPVNTLAQVFDDEHIKEVGLVKEMRTTRGTAVRMVGPVVEFSDLMNSVRQPPPYCGQHTIQILKQELNYSDSFIEHLFNTNTVQ